MSLKDVGKIRNVCFPQMFTHETYISRYRTLNRPHVQRRFYFIPSAKLRYEFSISSRWFFTEIGSNWNKKTTLVRHSIRSRIATIELGCLPFNWRHQSNRRNLFVCYNGHYMDYETSPICETRPSKVKLTRFIIANHWI